MGLTGVLPAPAPDPGPRPGVAEDARPRHGEPARTPQPSPEEVRT